MTTTDAIDWDALERMRIAFLAGTSGATDYWRNESDLSSYDATFAQRIGWKWDYVLEELRMRGWSPPQGDVLDWGCGSGVAGRAFLDLFGVESATGLRVWDRSSLAMSFAAKRAREKYPGLTVREGFNLAAAPDVLLISHVLNELSPEDIESLAVYAATATCVLWVEPGTFDASLTLIAIREKLRKCMNVVAPCTHEAACGILAPENERHWCHHFASPPPGVFTDGNWARFANLLGIELRDLPLSFLVLDKRQSHELSPNAARVIGHPRLYKGHALLLGCDATGVFERRLAKRQFPETFRQMRKGRSGSLCTWSCDGDVIREFQELNSLPQNNQQKAPSSFPEGACKSESD